MKASIGGVVGAAEFDAGAIAGGRAPWPPLRASPRRLCQCRRSPWDRGQRDLHRLVGFERSGESTWQPPTERLTSVRGAAVDLHLEIVLEGVASGHADGGPLGLRVRRRPSFRPPFCAFGPFPAPLCPGRIASSRACSACCCSFACSTSASRSRVISFSRDSACFRFRSASACSPARRSSRLRAASSSSRRLRTSDCGSGRAPPAPRRRPSASDPWRRPAPRADAAPLRAAGAIPRRLAFALEGGLGVQALALETRFGVLPRRSSSSWASACGVRRMPSRTGP